MNCGYGLGEGVFLGGSYGDYVLDLVERHAGGRLLLCCEATERG